MAAQPTKSSGKKLWQLNQQYQAKKLLHLDQQYLTKKFW